MKTMHFLNPKNIRFLGISFLLTLIAKFSLQAQEAFKWVAHTDNNPQGGMVITRKVVNFSNGDYLTVGQFKNTMDADFSATKKFNLTSVGDYDIFIARYNSANELLWAKSFGASSADVAYSAKVFSNGDFVVVGAFSGTLDFDPGPGVTSLTSSTASFDLFFARYTGNGHFVWANRVGNSGNDEAYDVALDANDNIYLTGAFQSPSSVAVDFDPGPGTAFQTATGANYDIFIASYTSSGDYRWALKAGDFGNDLGMAVACDANNNVYLGSYFTGASGGVGFWTTGTIGGNDVLFSKFNSAGILQWNKRIGGTGDDFLYSIAVDGNSDVYIAGAFTGTVDFDPNTGVENLVGAGDLDGFAAKFNTNGEYIWAKQFSSAIQKEVGRSIAVNSSGQCFVGGYFTGSIDLNPGPGTDSVTSSGNWDAFLVGLDANGDYMWGGKFGNTENEVVYAIGIDNNQNPIIVGQFSSSNDFDLGTGVQNINSLYTSGYVARYERNNGAYLFAGGQGLYGNLITNVNEIIISSAVDNSGNIYTVGTFEGTTEFNPSGADIVQYTSFGLQDVFIAKYSPSGALIWVKQIGGSGSEDASGIALDASGNLVISGTFSDTVDFDPSSGFTNLVSNGEKDVFFAKYNTNGDLVWAKGFGGSSNESCMGVAIDGSNNIVLVGNFNGTNVDFDPGSGSTTLSAGYYSSYFAKYNNNGDFVWVKSIVGTGGNNLASGLAIDNSGNIHLTGYYFGTTDFDPSAATVNLTNLGWGDIFVAKYDVNGNYVWAKRLAGTGDDRGSSIAVDGSGNVVVTGYFNGTANFNPSGTFNLISSGMSDIYLASYDLNGNMNWAYKGGSYGEDLGKFVKVDANRNVYLVADYGNFTVDFDFTAGVANLVNSGGFDVGYAKYTSTGSFVYASKVGGGGADLGRGITLIDTTDILVNGSFSGTVDFDPDAAKTVNKTSVSGSAGFIFKYGLCTAPDVPTLTATNFSVCSGNSTTLSVSSGNLNDATQWVWYTGSCGGTQVGTGTSIVVNPSVLTTYYVRGEGGCTTPSTCESITINTFTPPTPTANATNTSVCEGQTIALQALPNGLTSYTWTGPNSYFSTSQNPSITNAATTNAGSYTLNVKDANGCSATTSVSITVNTNPTSAPSVTNANVCQGGTIQLNGNPAGMTSYSWTGPNSFSSTTQNPSITNVPLAAAGNYNLTVTNANGCSNTASVSVTVLSLPNVSINPSDTILCVGNDLILSGLPNSMNSYTWTGPAGFNSTSQNPSISNLGLDGSGTYTLTVVDGNGCSSSANVSITVNANPVAVASSPKASVCSGENIELNGAPNGMNNYLWTTAFNGYTNNNQSVTIPSDENWSGKYYLQVTDANGCIGIDSIDITVYSLPIASAYSPQTSICQGSTLILNGGVNGLTSYTWSGPNGYYSNSQNTIISNVDADNAGSYTLSVKDGNGCTNSDVISITVNPLPNVSIYAPAQTVCYGGTIELQALPAGYVNYSWSSTTGFSASTQILQINSASPLMSGTYSVEVTDINGCKNVDSLDITVRPQLLAEVLSNDTLVCVGRDVNISVSPSFASYTWSGPDNFTSSNQAITIANAQVVNAGTYTVQIADLDGCTDTKSIDIVVNVPVQLITSANQTTLCENEQLELSVSPSNLISYTWNGPNNFASNTQNLTFVTSANSGGWYFIQAEDLNRCIVNDSIEITVNLLPELTANVSDSNICIGSNADFTASSSSLVTFSWSGPNGFITNSSNFNITNSTLADNGLYTIEIEDGNGCKNSEQFNLNVIQLVASIVSNPPAACEGRDITINALPNGMVSYSWSGVNNFSSNNQSVVLSGLDNSFDGVYQLFIEDNNGCKDTTEITLTVYPTPTVNVLSNNVTFCKGENLQLSSNATAGVTYTWSGPAGFSSSNADENLNNLSSINSGTYLLTVTTANGCASSDSIEIRVIQAQVTASVNTSEVCEGSTFEISATSINAVNYTWSGPASFESYSSINTINNATSSTVGFYVVSVQTAEGCVGKDSVEVTLVNITVQALAQNVSVCENSAIELSANSNNAVSFAWTGPANFSSSSSSTSIANAGASNAGYYVVKALSSEGCEAIDSINIAVVALPDVTVISNGPDLTAVLSGANYQWYDCDIGDVIANENSQTFIAPADGNYAVIISDNGCVDTSVCVNVIVSKAFGLKDASTNLEVNPNPNSGKFLVKGITSNSMLEITDLSGKLVSIVRTNNSSSIDVELDLPNGMYFVKEINTGKTLKFTIQH